MEKDLSELIQKHQQLSGNTSKEANVKQLEDTLKQKKNTIGILKSNIEENKKFIENKITKQMKQKFIILYNKTITTY